MSSNASVKPLEVPIVNSLIDQSASKAKKDAEPEFQSQDIYGSIAQEDYVKADDIDEIIGWIAIAQHGFSKDHLINI